MTIDIDQIQKFLKTNAQLIIIFVTIVFIYILFYTDYIVQNSDKNTENVII
jgi:predicted negative regulator of RcsB-dependent stress response